LKVYAEDGRIFKVEGDGENNYSLGTICPQGAAAAEIVHASDRLLYPQKKVGGSWKRVSWDEALGLVADKLKEIKQKYGPEAVVFHRGYARLSMGRVAPLINKLARLYGSPNISSPGHVCSMPRNLGASYVFGAQTFPEYHNSKCIILWGRNPTHEPPLAKRIYDAVKSGAKLIVIDPRITAFAERADVHLQPRPGTDGALALSMLNIIISQGLHDEEFVKKWTVGFNELKSLIADYKPQKAEEITWVPKEKIVMAATEYATNKPSCIDLGNGLDQHTNNFQAIRAISSLIAVTGNIDIPGGNVLRVPFKKFFITEIKKDHPKAIGQEHLPIFPDAHLPSIWNSILTGEPYQIKGMVVIGANPAVTDANTKIVIKALEKLEFLTVVDFFMTPTARFADVVLPASTFLETESGAGMKAVDPPGECWSDMKIIIELAKRMGFNEQFLPNVEEIVKEQSRPIQVSSVAEYKKYEKEGFPTASGKVEFYSSTLKSLGIDAMPIYVEPRESPISKVELTKQFPIILTSGGRVPMYTHSQFRNIPRLRKLMPHNILEIHPKMAAKFKIEDGDYVVVESPKGSVKLRAKLTNGILQGIVHIYHGFEDANVNELIDHKACDHATGSIALKSSLCRIRKAEQHPYK